MNNSRFLAHRKEQSEQEGKPCLILYTTGGCRFCAQAEDLLRDLEIAFVAVDIAEQETLLEHYGVRIPVVRHLQSGQELDWPFTPKAIQKLTNAKFPAQDR